jgi:hypothetical protein
MKSIKMNFVAGLTVMAPLPRVDYPPTAEELEVRIARFKGRKRALSATNAHDVWSKAAKMDLEAGGEPQFAENVGSSSSKLDMPRK